MFNLFFNPNILNDIKIEKNYNSKTIKSIYIYVKSQSVMTSYKTKEPSITRLCIKWEELSTMGPPLMMKRSSSNQSECQKDYKIPNGSDIFTEQKPISMVKRKKIPLFIF